MISLPLRWRFYVPKKNLEEIDEAIRPEFQTKHKIGKELVRQSVATLRKVTDKPIQLAFDVGYVSDELFKAMDELHVVVFARFKKNANFYELPERPAKAKRGRPRIYGAVFKMKDWIENNQAETFRECLSQYGGTRSVEFKTMIGTTQITPGRPVRLVLSRYVDGVKSSDWSVFVSTNLNATPQEILLEYSRRFSIEETSKDLKEDRSQEVRKWESCKAHTTITAMGFADVEIETWERNASELTALRPRWDDAERRPSHKNKRGWITRKIAFENFSRNIIGAKPEDIQKEILRLASLLGLAG